MRHLVELAGDLALLGVPARIAKLLLRLADPDGWVPEDVTQQEIAEMTGTVRQVANRVIAELAHLGVLELERGHIRVVDRARLAAQIGEGQTE
jgi:CRP/FNR family transcriptional regulator